MENVVWTGVRSSAPPPIVQRPMQYFAPGVSEAIEFHPYTEASLRVRALQNGEIDCVFPANLTDSDSESLGVVMSPPLMRTEMDAVVRAANQKEFIRQDEVTVAVNQGNTNYEVFLAEHFPNWKIRRQVSIFKVQFMSLIFSKRNFQSK